MPIRKATCHPKKNNFGGGLCANCYYRKRYAENKNEYRDKKNISGRKWREKNKNNLDLWRNYKLKFRFGITLMEYKKILRKQKGLCAAC